MQKEEDLLKIFEAYCSHGEPMNKTQLKSGKLAKLLRDCGLMKGERTKVRGTGYKIVQLPLTEMDLIFA